MYQSTKKILAAIIIAGGLIAIPFLEWPKGVWNEKVPNQFREPAEQVEPADNQMDADSISQVLVNPEE